MTTQPTTQNGTHDKATLSFPSDTELVVTRDFAYPPELVFRASTTPEIVKQWWGIAPREQFVVCEIDLQVGGQWRYVFRDADGNEDGFSGRFVEIEAPHRTVQTEQYEQMAGTEHTVTVTYTDNGSGRTTLSTHHRYPSQEMRDGHVASGMERGLQHSLDRVEDLLAELQEGAVDASAGGPPVSEISERYRRVAGRFTERVNEVPDAMWERPAPCDGWVARDVVRHLVEWMPAFLTSAGGPPLPVGPSVEDDPAGAWAALSAGIQALLDDPAASATEISHPQAGTHRLDDAIAMFFLGDILLHTWDLARATGLDETLDPEVVHDMLVGMEPLDEVLRASG